MAQRREQSIVWGIALAALDTSCIFAAFLCAAILTRPTDATLSQQLVAHADYFLLLVFAWYFQAIDQRLFVSRRGDSLIPQLFSYTKALFLAIVFTIFILALLRKTDFDRAFMLIYAGFAMLFMVFLRTTIRLGVFGLRRRGYSYRRILMIGANERAAHVSEIIRAQRHHGFQIVGFMDDDQQRKVAFEGQAIPYLGPVSNLATYLTKEVVDVVYISLPIRSHYEIVQRIAHLCEGVGVSVRLVADLFPLRIATSGLSRISDVPLLTLTRGEEIYSSTFIRRLADVAVALILIVLLAPLLLSIAVVLRLERRGPVFAWESFASPSGRIVRLLRFQTSRNNEAGEVEPTPFGQFLRRYGLDELPELVNIMMGQMSHSDPWRGLRPVGSGAEVREA